MPSIQFLNEDIKYNITKKRLLKSWILDTAAREGQSIESITFIFTSDNFLYNLNIEYLDHNTLTDIITFQYNDTDSPIESDVFISIERLRENAKTYNQKLLDEVHRIIIHGTLHLLGYKDKTKTDKEVMTSKEDYYLSLRPIELLSY
jgi:rRNA maturation RNase YbeY